jgi:FkbM family methyltransferase
VLLRCFAPRLRRRDFLIEIEPGILIPPELDDWIVQSFFTNGCEHNFPFQLSRSLIRQGDTVMDVGANIGLWAMGAALRVGPEGSVHAFEPVPVIFARLIRNLELNGLKQVISRQLALSDTCGQTVFYAAKGNSAVGSLTQSDSADQPIQIEMTTIDDYCENYSIPRVDVLKVDVEGAEQLVFRGAPRLLAADESPVIMFETDEHLTSRFSASSRSIKAGLAEHGYYFFRYDGEKLEKVLVEEPHINQEDLFALKPFHFEKYPLLNSLRT